MVRRCGAVQEVTSSNNPFNITLIQLHNCFGEWLSCLKAGFSFQMSEFFVRNTQKVDPVYLFLSLSLKTVSPETTAHRRFSSGPWWPKATAEMAMGSGLHIRPLLKRQWAVVSGETQFLNSNSKTA